MNNAKKIETWFDLFRILVAVAVAYVIALVILAIISDDPVYVIGQFITGPFSSFRRFGNILTVMIPIMFTGVCMCFVYAINKFNLGTDYLRNYFNALTEFTKEYADVPDPVRVINMPEYVQGKLQPYVEDRLRTLCRF